MRLTAPAHEQPLSKLPLRVIMRLTGGVPDVVLVVNYRPEFFGRRLTTWINAALGRGPSPLGQGERELLAAAVSKANQCDFCVASHTATATALLGEDKPADALDEERRAALSPAYRAVLEFVERLTRDPAAIGPEDVRRAVDAGATAAELRAAVEICGIFNIINRVADALDFEVPSERSLASGAQMLIRFGYG